MPISKRIHIALALTALLTCATWINVWAQDEIHQSTGTSSDCKECHPEVYDVWRLGGHSEIQTDHILGQSTNCTACHKEITVTTNNSTTGSDFPALQGQPVCMTCHSTGYDSGTGKWKANGVTCEACHSPMPANHPTKLAPIHTETDMCKNCHTSDRFDWESWQASAHYQSDMVCSVCHNPHTTSLKLMPGLKDASSLCQQCHKNESQNAQHSAHAKIGITCADCHLGEPTGPDDFHKIPDHDFKPNLQTCMKCHSAEMHAEKIVIITAASSPSAEPTLSVTLSANEASQPTLPNPFHLAGMTALVGVVGGIVLTIVRRR